jgi:hypothetical protein
MKEPEIRPAKVAAGASGASIPSEATGDVPPERS